MPFKIQKTHGKAKSPLKAVQKIHRHSRKLTLSEAGLKYLGNALENSYFPTAA